MPLDLLIVSVCRRAGGRSFIGLGETAPGSYGWIRLVAPSPDGVLYPRDYRILETAEPRPWDLIRVEAPWADSRTAQPENRVVDDTAWQLLERPASRPWIEKLERIPPARGPLFGTPGRAIRAAGPELPASILYVEPEAAAAVCEWDERREQFRSRLRFSVDGMPYDLPLADLHYSEIVRRRAEGVYTLDRAGCRAPHGLRLLVTLGESFHGWRYKTVSSILPRRTVTLWRDDSSTALSSALRNAADGPVEHARFFVAGA